MQILVVLMIAVGIFAVREYLHTPNTAPQTDGAAIEKRVVQSAPVDAQQDEIDAINERIRKLTAAGDYAAMLDEVRKLKKLEEAAKAPLGASQPDAAASDDEQQGDIAATAQKIDPNAINKRFSEFYDAGNYAAAIVEARKLETIVKVLSGVDNTNYASALDNLAQVYDAQGKYTEAAGLYQRVIAIREKALAPGHPNVVGSLNNLANVYYRQGKYAEAVELHQRALAIREKALDPSHPDVAESLTNLGNVYNTQGKYAEAEGLHKRALAISEKALDPSRPDVAYNLTGLALLYETQGKYTEAAGFYQRVIAIREKALAPGHPDVADSLTGLANVYYRQGKYADAAELHQRALAIKEKALGPSHPDVAMSLNNLALVYEAQGKYAEAEGNHQRAVAIKEKAHGPSHPSVAASLVNLANMYLAQGKYAEAAELLQRALAISEKALGPSHPDVARTCRSLAIVYGSAGNADLALTYSRKATAAVIAHAATGDTGSRRPDNAHGLIEQRADYFLLHILILAEAAGAGLGPAPTFGRESFEIAQWAVQSSAGAAVQQMALRFAAGDNALAALVRDNQDLAAAWRGQDKALIAALAKPEGQQDRATIEALRAAMAESESKLAANAARLDKEFPDYAALANPKPLSVEAAQKLLGADEALVFILPGLNESYVFALTAKAFDWKTIPLGAAALSDNVAAFRNGLDVRKRESFDLNLAQELYAALLGPVEALIKDKRHLLVAASGSLTALPFHLLVTEKPADAAPNRDRRAAYRNAAWLVKRHAVSVLPAVTSLEALRLFARKDQGAKPMIGFGNPVFDPKQTPAPDAAAKQRGAAKIRVKSAARATRAYSEVWSDAGVDYEALIADLKKKPLPETAAELKAVRLALGAPASDIHLGKDASETTVKRAPLADYRVVYFATHALVAGDVKGYGEPSIVLTVPKQPTEIDDALLTASEVAQLKLNADWVVLAACNTDAGDKEGAEALSGLARAFFYAGARALLVSHWEVDSDAATALNIATFDILKGDPSLGRAEAVRRAMLAYMNDASKPTNVYPALWGAFSVVGEGAAW